MDLNKFLTPERVTMKKIYNGLGSNSHIQLTEEVSNFDSIIINFRQGTNRCGSVEVFNPDGATAICNIVRIDSNQVRIFGSAWTIDGDELTPSDYFWCQVGSTAFNTNFNYISITDVYGVKTNEKKKEVV